MMARPHQSLLAKVVGWLLLHLAILALAFAGFLVWQLGLGLDSLLSGSAGDRLRSFGESAREEILRLPRSEWNAAIQPLADEKDIFAAVFDFQNPANFPVAIPRNVLERVKTALPPQPPAPNGRRGPGGEGPPPEGRRPPAGPLFDLPDGRPPLGEGPPPRMDGASSGVSAAVNGSRPLFLLRGQGGTGYWAGIQLSLPGPSGRPPRHHLLLLRSESLDGSGMFFDFKPWLWGGLAVLALSIAFWAPFVWGITRYLNRLKAATDRVAAGDFRITAPPRRNDELGNLGQAIAAMADRLDQSVSRQKRFMGDAAHELCAPLARMRTGLGILEMKLGECEQPHLASVEADVQELATLVEEILAFSKAGNRAPRREPIRLEAFICGISAREAGQLSLDVSIPAHLEVVTDPTLLGRAIGNLIRNAAVHAGPDARVLIQAQESADFVAVSVTDNGPGVPQDELARLFEPFYRPDRSRSRDTGGSGLGLAIVRTAIESSGGEAFAAIPSGGGFSVTLRLPKTASGTSER